jgi:signal transduction histidine kinase
VAYVNKDKIWRLFNNLISNAIKFSYERADIQIGIHRKDGRIRFSVKDKGIGIPEKNKSSIFDMFTESKMYGTSGEKPNGLGLSISLQIAKAHGGNIWFESEQGKGTTFYVDLPEKLPE